jgi:osmoprotectant transport system permease protein
VIGTKPFAEQYVLAALIEQRLRDAGLSARRREGLGSGVIYEALRTGDIDVYVDYSGTLWANLLKREEIKPREELLNGLTRALRERDGTLALGDLGFENAYALAMTADKARTLGARSIADLSAKAPGLSIAGDYEFFGRPEWRAIKNAYRLTFREERQMQPEFMYAAAASGDVDVIAGYTSDGRIALDRLTVLDDPKHAIPPYDAILLVSPRSAGDGALIAALRPLIGAIDVGLMREANARVSRGLSPEQTAAWLWSEIERKRKGQVSAK